MYLPLIVVNCIILGRAEAFAGKSPVLASALDGLGMGIGFMAALLAMGAIRELFGAGTLLGYQIIPGSIAPMIISSCPRRLLRIRHAHRLRKPARRAQRKAEGNAQLRLLPDGGRMLARQL